MRTIVFTMFLMAFAAPAFSQPRFSCDDEPRYCKQVKSCPEACFYLHQCDSYKKDRDHDNKPCENVCKRTCTKAEMRKNTSIQN